METYSQQTVEGLRKRIEKAYPGATLETGIFNSDGEIIMRVNLNGTKTIDATNLKALDVIATNLEMQKRAKERAVKFSSL